MERPGPVAKQRWAEFAKSHATVTQKKGLLVTQPPEFASSMLRA
jgi:hypothetical protein